MVRLGRTARKRTIVTVKSSISLTDQQDAFARKLVHDGRYASVSAVVQQALELLRQKTAAEEADTVALTTLLTERQAGQFVPSAEMATRVDRMIAAKRKAYDVDD